MIFTYVLLYQLLISHAAAQRLGITRPRGVGKIRPPSDSVQASPSGQTGVERESGACRVGGPGLLLSVINFYRVFLRSCVPLNVLQIISHHLRHLHRTGEGWDMFAAVNKV
jgi:hypothetical protein